MFPYVRSGTPARRVALPTLRVCLTTSVNPGERLHHRHAQRLVSPVIPDSGNLAICLNFITNGTQQVARAPEEEGEALSVLQSGFPKETRAQREGRTPASPQ